MFKRIVAIAFIFACAAAAWMILGATIFSRTYDSGETLDNRVAILIKRVTIEVAVRIYEHMCKILDSFSGSNSNRT